MVEIDADAPVVARDEIAIAAPIETVWALLVDVPSWARWRSGIETAEADGPLTVGSVFRRRASGLDVESTVAELDAPHRFSWTGGAQGIDAVHVWKLEAREHDVLVRTEESWSGQAVSARTESMQTALDALLRVWLEQLKREAEQA